MFTRQQPAASILLSLHIITVLLLLLRISSKLPSCLSGHLVFGEIEIGQSWSGLVRNNNTSQPASQASQGDRTHTLLSTYKYAHQ